MDSGGPSETFHGCLRVGVLSSFSLRCQEMTQQRLYRGNLMISELSLLRRKSSEGKTPFLSSSDRSSELLIFPLQQLTTCSLSILNLERTRASGPVPNFQAKVMEAPRAEPGGKLCLLSARQHARHSALPCLTLEFFCKMGVVIPLLQLKKLNSKAGCLFSHTASSLVRFHQLLS